MNEILIAVIGSGALSATISGLFSLAINRKNKRDSTMRGVQQLMYDRIKFLCKYHLSKGFIATNDLEDLERMHRIYHDDLEGNGYLDDLMKKVRDMPVNPARFER